MSGHAIPLFVTFDEYLRLEDLAEVKHEYVRGTIVAMAGGSLAHNRMTLELAGRYRSIARAGGCDLFSSDVLVEISGHTAYYPDLVVSCVDDGDERVVRNPCLVVEVLSKSTASIDRREKRVAYQTISSLQCYLVVDPNFVHIEAHIRNTSGAFDGWDHRQLGHGSVITLPCLESDLDVTELYASLDISDVPPPPSRFP
jgi:Uma2 family endonuclease